MSQITEWKMLSSFDGNNLESLIYDAIQQGWQPFGSMSVVLSKETRLLSDASKRVEQYALFQPMVKYLLGTLDTVSSNKLTKADEIIF